MREGVRTERPSRDAGRPKRLAPGRVHRDALIASLPPEQQPIADQLFRGGIPAVRQAIIDQNAQLKASGGTEIQAAPLLALAEDLLPKTRQADWLDSAAAALQSADSLSLRDLRAVVTQSDGIAKDDPFLAKVKKAYAHLSKERSKVDRDKKEEVELGKRQDTM